MRVIFLGGGTLGHVVPNLAVIEELYKRSRKHHVLYIGENGGKEKEAVKKFDKSIIVKEIICGKLRRYFSFKNVVDFFKVPVGFLQSFDIIARFNPDVIFSKGGYVSVPPILAAGFINFFRGIVGREKIMMIIHESDAVPGLATKIGAGFAEKILVSFEETRKYFDKNLKPIVTGNPVRSEIFKGKKEAGLKICGFNRFKPVILAMGGSLGAQQVNNLVWNNLDILLKKCQVVHITGKGNLNFGINKTGYKQFELLFNELKDVYSASDLIISRGGANSLAEIASLQKKAVIIPLGTNSSRGDQLVNAKICGEKYGWQILFDDISNEQFLRAIDIALKNDFGSEENLHKSATKTIVDLFYSRLTN